MNKILELQALRFYAVMIVIFYHYSIYFHGGFAGVDLFFIISGFIIGKRYLLRDNFSLLDFYRRRVLRILPMATIALIFSTIVTFLTNREGFDKLFNTLLTLVTYTYNFFQISKSNNYWDNHTLTPFFHFWSLSVEEEFYLISAGVAALLMLTKKKNLFLWLIGIFSILSFSFALFNQFYNEVLVLYSPMSRGWEFGVGILLASVYDRIDRLRNSYFFGFLVLGSLMLIASAVFSFNRFNYEINPVLMVFGGAFIIISSAGRNVSNNLFWKAMVYGGDVSYCLYLWHIPVYQLFKHYLPARPATIYSLIVLFLITFISHHLIEEPFRSYRPKNISRNSLVPGLVFIFSIILPLMSWFAIKSFEPERLDLNQFKSKILVQANDTGKYDNHCTIAVNEIVSKECLSGDVNGTKSIVLYGDSHAAEWFAPINQWAIKNHFKLYLLYKGGCEIPNLTYIEPGTEGILPVSYKTCDEWKKLIIPRILKMNPDYFIVTSNVIANLLYPQRDGSIENYQRDLGLALEPFRDLSSKKVYILDTPIPITDMPKCLSDNFPVTSKCDFKIQERGVRLNQEANNAVKLLNYEVWDYNKKICVNDFCKAVDNNILYFKDNSHITENLALYLTPEISKDLNKLTSRK